MKDHNLQLRWADLDTLNHVNNVRYVDYALEATGRLIDDGELPADVDITRIEVDFLRPLVLSLKPIRISNTVIEGRLVQKIAVEDTVYAKITTDLGSRTMRFAKPHEGQAHHCQLRRTDLDGSGHVMPAKVFELFQESRILHLARVLEHHSAGNFVLGKLIVEFHRPIGWRTQPLPVASWISGARESSMAVTSHISDGDEVLASCESILVGFDMVTQKSRKLTEAEKSQISASVHLP